MSKYDPLWKYFQDRKDAVIELTFEEIHKILGFAIDHSFLNYKKELLDKGYKVRKIHLKEKRIVFEKVDKRPQ